MITVSPIRYTSLLVHTEGSLPEQGTADKPKNRTAEDNIERNMKSRVQSNFLGNDKACTLNGSHVVLTRLFGFASSRGF
jgi:hypothetical protein